MRYSAQQAIESYSDERQSGKYNQNEYEADKYSAQKIGHDNALNALKN